jgi:hypothetical protein
MPAVAHYYMCGIFRYFFTAGAIGILYKENAWWHSAALPQIVGQTVGFCRLPGDSVFGSPAESRSLKTLLAGRQQDCPPYSCGIFAARKESKILWHRPSACVVFSQLKLYADHGLQDARRAREAQSGDSNRAEAGDVHQLTGSVVRSRVVRQYRVRIRREVQRGVEAGEARMIEDVERVHAQLDLETFFR